MRDRRDPLIGAWIAGRFRVERRLAEGGMGRVYLARQAALDRLVALKILHVQNPAHEQPFQRRFDTEAAVLGRLKHPHTVRVFDYGVHEGKPFIAMEYVEGPTLAERMGRPMHPLAAIRLVRQLAAAVDEAHDHGVVHRDLKPMNVVLAPTKQGQQAKVLDFGIAALAHTDDRGPDGMVLGTSTYMAPEQVQGLSVDHRADLYALGVILYRLLAGAAPFEVDSTRAMLHAHLTQAPVPFAEQGIRLPRVLEWTVRACLRKHPEDRIASARDLAAALNHCELALRYRRFDILPRLERGRVVLPEGVQPLDGGFAGLRPQRDAAHWLYWAGAGFLAAVFALGAVIFQSPPADRVEVLVPVPVMVEAEPEAFSVPGRAIVELGPVPDLTPSTRASKPRASARPALPLLQPRIHPASDLLDPFADRR